MADVPVSIDHPPRTVRVWAASDLHGKDPADLPVQPDGCDIAILAGDVCPLPDWSLRAIELQPHWLNVVLGEWAASRPELQVVVVPGNHDVFLKRRDMPVLGGTVPKVHRSDISLPPNVHLLIDEEVVVCGVKVYGTPWVPYIDGRWAFEANSEIRERQWFDCIPPDTALLVTHSPPYIGGLSVDCPLQYPTERNRHLGSKPLSEAIARVNPSLCVFGHVHSGDHSLHVLPNGTALRNVSVLDENYRFAYNPAVIDMPVRKEAVARMVKPRRRSRGPRKEWWKDLRPT